jgi:hypothetical protein
MKKLVEHYKEWIESRKISDDGLCNAIPAGYFIDLMLFRPTEDDLKLLIDSEISSLYWASGVSRTASDNKKRFALTPLRETIILLICAMHDEI